MTTWTAFKTIDEMASTYGSGVIYIDRLGIHGYIQNERTRFVLSYQENNGLWHIGDLDALEDDDVDLVEEHIGTMRECVQWMAGRILYSA